MPNARAVRIARLPAVPEPPRPPAAAEVGQPNRSGRQRGVRTYLLFLAPLAGIYLGLVELLLASPSPGLRGDVVLYELFTGILLLAGGVGFLLTVPSAPRWVRIEPDRMMVQGWLGPVRRYPRDERLRVLVVERHAGGLLSSGPTEQVLVVHPEQRTRRYLVEEGLIPPERPSAR